MKTERELIDANLDLVEKMLDRMSRGGDMEYEIDAADLETLCVLSKKYLSLLTKQEEQDNFYCKEWYSVGYRCEGQCLKCAKAEEMSEQPKANDVGQRQKLIAHFKAWFDTNPYKGIAATECANIAMRYFEAMSQKDKAEIKSLKQANAELVEALREISLGEGAYDYDRLKHCSNTVDNMREIANKALSKHDKQ